MENNKELADASLIIILESAHDLGGRYQCLTLTERGR